jgi:hypothetical protein
VKKWPVKLLIAGGLVTTALNVWVLGFRSTHIDKELVITQSRRPVKVTRVYTGPDGQSHAEEIVVKMLPGADATESSEQMNVSGMRIRRTPPNYVFKGTAPRRMYVITLSGRAEIELADGKKVPIDRDHIVLLEDLTGKGRVLRGVGSEDRISIQLPVQE